MSNTCKSMNLCTLEVLANTCLYFADKVLPASFTQPADKQGDETRVGYVHLWTLKLKFEAYGSEEKEDEQLNMLSFQRTGSSR